jgi:hypothetical protein
MDQLKIVELYKKNILDLMHDFNDQFNKKQLNLEYLRSQINLLKNYDKTIFALSYSDNNDLKNYYFFCITNKEIQNFYNLLAYLTFYFLNDFPIANSVKLEFLTYFYFISDPKIYLLLEKNYNILKDLGFSKVRDFISHLIYIYKFNQKFTGSIFDNFGFYLYLNNKYSNILCTKYNSIITCEINITNFNNHSLFNHSIKTYTELYKNKSIKLNIRYCSNISDILYNCKIDKKFVLFYIGIYNELPSSDNLFSSRHFNAGHVNYLLYNPFTNELEHYDPNGSCRNFENKYFWFECFTVFNNALKKFANDVFKDIIYVSIDDVCKNKRGFQEEFQSPKHKDGICFLWTPWYLEKRLQPQYREKTATFVFHELINEYNKLDQQIEKENQLKQKQTKMGQAKLRNTLSNDIMYFQTELTLSRPSILNIPDLPDNIKEFLLNGWIMQNINPQPYIEQIEKIEKNKLLLK